MTPWRPFPLMLAAASLACLVVIGPASADGHHRDRQVSVMPQADADAKREHPAIGGEPMSYLIDFQTPEEAHRWRAINDSVMGGISRGGMRVAEGVGLFSGETSLENNGGFASVRRDPEAFDLSREAGMTLFVRGDGRHYQLRLYTDQLPQGAAYRAEFQPAAGDWQRITLRWRDFAPVFRGRLLSDVPPIDPAGIEQVGLMIVDRQAGPFRLEIAGMAPFRH